jgi:glycosyltransferase involved in cell wall biosynthesis
MYKVTLAMPVYNVEKYIERALLSALNQTFESIEYLLIDDRGSDNSISLAKEIIKNHPRGKDVRIIAHEVNIGTGATKNTAIDNAQGEFLYFMDSDDEITPDCISLLYNKMLETPVDFVAASHKYIACDEKYNEQFIYENIIINDAEFAVAKGYYVEKKDIFIQTWNKLYNVNFLRKKNIKCIPHHLNEDVFFTHQVILNAQSCQLLSNIVYLHYEIEKSTMSKIRDSFTSKIGKQFKEICQAEKSYLQNYQHCDFYSILVKYTYSFALYYAFCIYNSKIILGEEKKNYISCILEYPLSFKEVIKMKDRFHFIMYIVSKFPTIKLKILVHKNFLFLVRSKA